MKRHTIRAGLTLGILILMGISAPSNAETQVQNRKTDILSNLIREGLSQNQEIQSLAYQGKALQAEIDFAGSLDDPRVGIGLLALFEQTDELLCLIE